LVLTGLCRFEVAEELAERDGYRRVRPDWRRFAADYELDGGARADLMRGLMEMSAFGSVDAGREQRH
jgi:hypothetical protein